MEEEHVGGLGFDVVGLEHVGREVAEILSDNDLGAGSDGGGKDVAVVRVGEAEPIDELLVASGEAVRDLRRTSVGGCGQVALR